MEDFLAKMHRLGRLGPEYNYCVVRIDQGSSHASLLVYAIVEETAVAIAAEDNEWMRCWILRGCGEDRPEDTWPWRYEARELTRELALSQIPTPKDER